MKTKQQLKDEYASSLGYGNWSTAIKCLALFDATHDSIKAIDKFIDGYQELCCNEVARASLEKASENAKFRLALCPPVKETILSNGHVVTIYKQSITSPDNIVLL